MPANSTTPKIGAPCSNSGSSGAAARSSSPTQIAPSANNTYDLGTQSLRWSTGLFAQAISLGAGAGHLVYINGNNLALSNTFPVGWSSAANAAGGTFDTQFVRNVAGIVSVRGTGTTSPGALNFYTYGASPPSAPAASTATLYVDTSGGKDRACILFSSGAAQCFATQP